MHLLFDEDGSFKAGTVLAATDSSYQVELVSGKRTKVRASHVLLRYEQPAPGALLEAAQREAEAIDLDFLWECAPQQEFAFEDLAREYFGAEASAVEAATVLFRLHNAPVYFHRKGRGRYKPAPPEILQQALAALERKRKQEEQRQQYVDALKAGSVPAPIGRAAIALLTKPDRNSIEYKALETAASELQMTPLRLLLARGAVDSPYAWHRDSFIATTFPAGIGFGSNLPAPVVPQDLPDAGVLAFAIDDSATTEIDDAFSVQFLDDRVRVGVHIAAPAVSIRRGDAIDSIARGRMSTVYAPGEKITMLPPAWIEAFTLEAGRHLPALSLYVDVDPDSLAIIARETRLQCVRIDANLRHDQLDEVVTEERIAAGALDDVAHGRALSFLWHFARTLQAAREVVRGKPEPTGRVDYTFRVEGEGDAARVEIVARRRGAPLDLIVAELMVLANSHWGGWLAEFGRVGIYRSQRIDRNASGPGAVSRVRMSTSPAAHDGIGVPYYAWSTSPLRRYVDLVNQQQLVALVRGDAPPYAPTDAELFGIISAFDAAYASYAEYQERMERYWCLRWLLQQDMHRIDATILRPDLVRIDRLPLVTRVLGLPLLERGTRIELDVLAIDLTDLSIELRLHRVLVDQIAQDALDDEREPAPEHPAATGDSADHATPGVPQAG